MTGYGRAEGEVAGTAVTVELRSLNHRFKDLHLFLPRGWLALEVEAEKLLRERIGRGRIECQVRTRGGAGGAGEVQVDLGRARQVYGALKKLAKALGQRARPSLDLVAGFEGVLGQVEALSDPGAAAKQLRVLLEKALRAMEAMRSREGVALAAELDLRLKTLAAAAEELQRLVPGERAALLERSAQRVRELAGQAEVSSDRLAQELALQAERMDVTEELVRLMGHLAHFRELMARAEPSGRELDFLLQEMNREVNTLSAKIHSSTITRLTVALKSEIEKVREQVQNVE
jgi:uncharacterized protein (TIGR00255 family)